MFVSIARKGTQGALSQKAAVKIEVPTEQDEEECVSWSREMR
jgi:hypothetical protein